MSFTKHAVHVFYYRSIGILCMLAHEEATMTNSLSVFSDFHFSFLPDFEFLKTNGWLVTKVTIIRTSDLKH